MMIFLFISPRTDFLLHTSLSPISAKYISTKINKNLDFIKYLPNFALYFYFLWPSFYLSYKNIKAN